MKFFVIITVERVLLGQIPNKHITNPLYQRQVIAICTSTNSNQYLWVYSGTQWTNHIQHADAYPNRFRLLNPLDNRHSNRYPNPHRNRYRNPHRNRHHNRHDGTVCLYAESRNHTCGRHGDSLSGQNQSPSASKPNDNETMTLAFAFTNVHGHRHRHHGPPPATDCQSTRAQ